VVAAYITHAVPGRLRLRVPAYRNDVLALKRLARRLGEHEAVSTAEVNRRTGSVLILHSTSPDEIGAFAAEGGLFKLATAAEAAPSIADEIIDEMRKANRQVARLSSGEFDLESIVFISLLAGSAVQILRGQILAPAVTLAWYASTLLMQRGAKSNGNRNT